MARTETFVEPTTVLETLRVYNVHESGSDETPEPNASQTQSSSEASAQRSDLNWPSDWRRLPPYRESSRTHRVADRAAGQTNAEGALVVAMFTGVWLFSVRDNTQSLWAQIRLTPLWHNSMSIVSGAQPEVD